MVANVFDILFAVTAVIANLSVSGIYISDRHNSMKYIRIFGIIFLSLGIPMIAVLIGYSMIGYVWWVYAVLCYVIAFFVVQLLLDYILKSQFREKPVQHIVYIVFFYAFQAGLILVGFNIDKVCGYAVSISFWILLGALIYLLIGKQLDKKKKTKPDEMPVSESIIKLRTEE